MTLHEYPDTLQRSEEWFAQRRGMVTASAVGKLLTVGSRPATAWICPECAAEVDRPCTSKVKRGGEYTPIKTLHPQRIALAEAFKDDPDARVILVANNDTSRGLTLTLAAERISGYTDPTPISAAMWNGIEGEPHAVEVYREHIAPVDVTGFMVEDGWGFSIGYSPDGLVGDDGLIEVKTRYQKTQLRTILDDEVPLEVMPQLQCGLLVTGRKWIDYVSYTGGMHLYVKRVLPDPIWQDAIVEAVRTLETNAANIVATYSKRTQGMPLTERIDNELGLVF